ncbi:hypothetical protein KW795_01420, partial [Candidatus Microgenomates bacterium]|nr:hypothetical protein [Candidatus Microgenomates bacterium]
MITLFLTFLWQIILYARVDRFIWEDGIVEPWFIVKGLMFHKDFYSTYLPLPKILMIPINLIFNWNLAITPILGLLLSFATIFLIYKMSQSKRLSILFFCLFYTFILAQNTFDINLWLGFLILVAINIYFSWLKKQTKLKTFFIGIITAIAVLSTQHTIIPMTILGLTMISSLYLKKRSIKKLLTDIIFPVVLGGLCMVTPILIWYYLRNALSDLYFWTVDYYLRGNGYPFSKFGFSQKDLIFFFLL